MTKVSWQWVINGFRLVTDNVAGSFFVVYITWKMVFEPFFVCMYSFTWINVRYRISKKVTDSLVFSISFHRKCWKPSKGGYHVRNIDDLFPLVSFQKLLIEYYEHPLPFLRRLTGCSDWKLSKVNCYRTETMHIWPYVGKAKMCF